ncbi:MAG: glutamine--fructose-6-phosphate aminotransferase [Gammaproteobacteria bacterium GWE2_42_36]|nr:MAG: glutamine--fructose-6-phosphate aminotransferase [Gammaproteobacteria bacterium GWE2_42_36]
MCGIIGAISQRDVAEILLEGLRRLEYRGYDSAGIALLNDKNQLIRYRMLGKVEKLCQQYQLKPIAGRVGIAHTRWATHGIPHERNAHPHLSGEQIAVVHNGIIENHEVLRDQLKKRYRFTSETDTEVIAHCIHLAAKKQPFLKAVMQVIKQLQGAYALSILNADEPDHLIVARSGSPLVIGLGFGENFVASDTLALLPVTRKFIFLEDGDVADVYRDRIDIYNAAGKHVERKIYISEADADVVTRGHYRHFMQKEIFEQPAAIAQTLEGRLLPDAIPVEAFGPLSQEIFSQVQQVQIVACGTSYHAGLVAKYWLEDIARIPCHVEIASEIRYRKAVVQPNTLFVVISQSGETADTLAALRLAKQQRYLATLAICNVPESSIVRESDLVFLTRAGAEIGVASTKAFTTQLSALLILAMALGQSRLTRPARQKMIRSLQSIAEKMTEALKLDTRIEKLAQQFAEKEHALFLGRGMAYPIAMEGALKLKEISYIHAEAYPAGELKHGPLALVDKQMPVVAIAPNDHLWEKLASNLQEVLARGGELIVFADQSLPIKNNKEMMCIKMPKIDALIAPIIYTIPLQLLAYHVAVLKGTDVDRPRNLAKSVTVE